jgi:hypothetical protein
MSFLLLAIKRSNRQKRTTDTSRSFDSLRRVSVESASLRVSKGCVILNENKKYNSFYFKKVHQIKNVIFCYFFSLIMTQCSLIPW